MTEFDFNRVESIIRAAGDYVQPSEYLRPRTLEAARQHCGDRRAEQKLGGFVLAVLLLAIISSPAAQYAEVLRSKSTWASATDMHQQALAYESSFKSGTHFGAHWGLAEAFTQLRRVQAARFGQNNRIIK